MKKVYKDYLFDKHILVGGHKVENVDKKYVTFFSLLRFNNIRITEGDEYLDKEMILEAAERQNTKVNMPFYRGFPKTVRRNSASRRLFDQLYVHVRTKGIEDFMKGDLHSVFDGRMIIATHNEDKIVRDYRIISEEEAEKMIHKKANELLLSTGPLCGIDYGLVKNVIIDYDPEITVVKSRDTAVKLLRELRDMRFADYLYLSDVIRFLDDLTYYEYKNAPMYKLNLKNQDRKFITALIRRLFLLDKCDIRKCFEKKKIWNGLLHHIHYKPMTEKEREFVNAIRSDKNLSVNSEFEKLMKDENITGAVDCLKKNKGAEAVLRNLNYILSRCNDPKEVEYVIDNIETDSGIILMQLLMKYFNFKDVRIARDFTFAKYSSFKSHVEKNYETKKRRSNITKEQADLVVEKIKKKLRDIYKGSLGKVYIDKEMDHYALPIHELVAQSGFGAFSRGSRIKFDETKKLRVFTYWEKVYRVHLWVYGMDENGRRIEFSEREMFRKKIGPITFDMDSGSGYKGGSGYYDIKLEQFKEKYPNIRYLVFWSTVGTTYERKGLETFDEFTCRVGYILGDIENSGHAYEPKKINTTFDIDCRSLSEYIFGLDLLKNEFVWLNMTGYGLKKHTGVYADDFLMDYLNATDVINMKNFFEMLATELVDDISEADVVVTCKNIPAEKLAENAKVIREYDLEKMMALMN